MPRSTKVVAAAVIYNGKMYQGRRHTEIMKEIYDEFGTVVKIIQEDQGFVSDTGEFLSRWKAGAVAFAAGQTKRRHETLLSEDVW